MPEEKLPEWFETDFFLHDKQQRSWDELEVGEEYETMPFTVTAERIAKYVRAPRITTRCSVTRKPQRIRSSEG